jgi:hypothetical protein
MRRALNRLINSCGAGARATCPLIESLGNKKP